MSKKSRELNLNEFPPHTVTEYSTLVCLACIFDIFTRQFGMAPRTAYSKIKRYSPTIEELTGAQAARPFFDSEEKNPHCPHCNDMRDSIRVVLSEGRRRRLRAAN